MFIYFFKMVFLSGFSPKYVSYYLLSPFTPPISIPDMWIIFIKIIALDFE